MELKLEIVRFTQETAQARAEAHAIQAERNEKVLLCRWCLGVKRQLSKAADDTFRQCAA